MRDGKGTAVAIIGGVILAGLLLGVLTFKGCERRDEAGQRADSVLATDTVYARDTLRQDSAIARLDSALAAQETRTRFWRDSAKRAERVADSLARNAAVLDSQLGLKEGLTPHDSIVVLTRSRDLWRGSALHYSRDVVPALRSEIEMERTGKLMALAKATELQRQRDYARDRADDITREFRDYREASKPGIDLGFIRLPEWVGYAGAAVGAVAVTCAATC